MTRSPQDNLSPNRTMMTTRTPVPLYLPHSDPPTETAEKDPRQLVSHPVESGHEQGTDRRKTTGLGPSGPTPRLTASARERPRRTGRGPLVTPVGWPSRPGAPSLRRPRRGPRPVVVGPPNTTPEGSVSRGRGRMGFPTRGRHTLRYVRPRPVTGGRIGAGVTDGRTRACEGVRGGVAGVGRRADCHVLD